MAVETETDTESRGETTDVNASDVDASLRYGSTLVALGFGGLGAFGTGTES